VGSSRLRVNEETSILKISKCLNKRLAAATHLATARGRVSEMTRKDSDTSNMQTRWATF